ncbi:uncharacterized protein LOC104894724 isoform X4 [Beta vulgaris subsp. vulgaris]|uniref:uncharacterized protein LOC104894724 isoform X4 n=1 Tax=Beta vulgaris subsp. vulgaris TaxID=3555 RepID=UPI0020369158|nr:uncharacterized protein LOC104894724 isoform X4 [Beta vulgaris subsp. vulgaris]
MADKQGSSSRSSSADKKRKRVADSDFNSQIDNVDSFNDEEILSLEKSLTFSDTLVALRMMRAQFPKLEKVLKRDKVLRVFKLTTGQDDHAVMFLEDYIHQIDTVSKKIETRKEGDFAVFGWFKSHVIMSKLEPSVAHEELCSLLSAGGKVKDEQISLLVNAGILTRQLIDPNIYWFAIPNIGSILKGISQGRKELLSFLNRRKFKEMMLSSLEKKRLRFSSLDMRFHLRDLIGSGHLQTFQSPTGIVVRVLKD